MDLATAEKAFVHCQDYPVRWPDLAGLAAAAAAAASSTISVAGLALVCHNAAARGPAARARQMTPAYCLLDIYSQCMHQPNPQCLSLPQGIQFVKQLARLDEPAKQRAEVAAWLHDFEGAEQQYLQMERPDLAVDLQVGGGGGGC
jgi:hypothetical protein